LLLVLALFGALGAVFQLLQAIPASSSPQQQIASPAGKDHGNSQYKHPILLCIGFAN
jgi:hypothetical protein